MKYGALFKNIFRGIKDSFGRFMSILLMLSVGIMIFVGLKATGPFMAKQAKNFLSKTKTADIVVSSNYGLDPTDQKELEKIQNVSVLEFGYKKNIAIKKSDHPVTLMSMNDKVSLTEVKEGRVPKNASEILLDTSLKDSGYKIGQKIIFKKDKDDSLKNYTFTIVGFGNNPDFIQRIEKGTANIGTGRIKGFGLVQKKVFQKGDYQQARFLFHDLKGIDLLSDTYQTRVLDHQKDIEKVLSKGSKDKMKRVEKEIHIKIQDGKKEIQKAKDQLEDAKEKIAKGKDELADGYDKYHQNKKTFEEKIASAEMQLKDAANKIASGRVELENSRKLLAASEKKLREGESQYLENEKKLKDSKDKLDQGQSELQKAKMRLEEEQKKLEDAILILQKNEKAYYEGLSTLQENEKAYEKGVAQYQKALAQWEIQSQRLQTQIEKINQEIATKTTQYDVLKKEYDQKKREIDQLQEKIQSINEQIEKEKNNSSLQALKSKSDQLQAEISALQAQLETAPEDQKEQILLAIQNKEAEKSAIQQQITALEQEIQQKIDRLTSEKNELQEKIHQIKLPDLESLQSELNRLQGNKEIIEKEIRDIRQGFEVKKQELERAKYALDTSRKQLEQAQQQLEKGKKEIEAGRAKLQNAQKQWMDNELKLQIGFAQYEEGKTQLEQALDKLEQGRAQLNNGYVQLQIGENQLNRASEKYRFGSNTLASNRRTGIQKLQDALRKLQNAQNELHRNELKFQDKRKDANKEIQKGEKDIKKAEDQQSILVDPIYNVVAAPNGYGIYEYFDATGRLAIVSNIFPIFFFLISILVSMTTMTRMVDESREQMGTMKALGYENKSIVQKFTIYALAASILGAVLGIIIGHKVIGLLVAKAYMASFIFDVSSMDYNWYYSFLGLMIGLICTVGVSYVVSRRVLKRVPAELMRKKAPAKGSRIFLERIKPVWNRLTFIQKVTARNIFRYKKRMLMTIFGIAGCTGLMFMGFGIQNSLNGILDRQYHDIFKYNYIIVAEDKLDREKYKSFEEELRSPDVKKHFKVEMKELKVKLKNGASERVTAIATDRPQKLKEFVLLKDRKTQKPLSLTKEGIVISETLANTEKVSKGDDLLFVDAYGKEYRAKITGITENYAGHYIYMTDSMYEKLFGQKFEKKAELIDITGKNQEEITKKFLNNDTVVSLTAIHSMRNILQESIDSLNMLVVVIVLCACLLAFVVLYNLNNINISERKQELSTIKVLGFYDKEVTAYVYRETLILSVLGIGIGFLFGRIMHSIILNKLIPNMLMLDPRIQWTNYVLSTAITVLFTLIVMGIIHYRLQHIDMIEALKED